MTLVDVAVALLLAVGAVAGLYRGALRQSVRLAAWASAAGVPVLLAGPLAGALQEPLEAPLPQAFAFAWAAVALLTWLAVRLSLHALLRPREVHDPERKARRPAAWDRTLGALLGAGTTAGLVWALFSVAALVLAPADSPGTALRPSPALASSAFYRFAEQHNAAASLYAARLERLRTAAARSAGAKPGDARLAALLADPALVQALRRGDLRPLLRSPAALSLLAGPEPALSVRLPTDKAPPAPTAP